MTFLSAIDLRRLSEGTSVCADALATNAKNARNRLVQRNMFVPQLAEIPPPKILSDLCLADNSRNVAFCRALAAGFAFDRSAPRYHTAGNADAEHVEPAVHEIEQVRAHQRRDDVLDHDDGTDPGGQTRYAKQKIVRNPHRQQHDSAEKA